MSHTPPGEYVQEVSCWNLVRLCRQAHVDDESRDDDSGRCPVKNDSRDVRRDDVSRALSATKSAAGRYGDAASTIKSRRPVTDEVSATADPVRPTSNHTVGAQASSRPIPISGAGVRSSDCSRAVPRSPDAEWLRRRADNRRPESSPLARRVSCGQSSCDQVDSVGNAATSAGRRPTVTRANTTGGYLLKVPDVVYPPRGAAVPSPTSSDGAETPVSTSLPERWPAGTPAASPYAQRRRAPRVYYSNSEDRVSATDAETRAIVPSLPYSPSASPGSSPRLRRQPTIETRRLSVTETDEGWTQLNQYKLKDEIGKVRRRVCLLVNSLILTL